MAAIPHEDWKPQHNPYLIAMTVTLATFMEVLDSSIANVAIPTISGNLGVSVDEGTWVITVFAAANAIAMSARGALTARLEAISGPIGEP